MHLCTVCLLKTDSFIICNYFGHVHGFSMCQDIACVSEFQMQLNPVVMLMGFQLWV